MPQGPHGPWRTSGVANEVSGGAQREPGAGGWRRKGGGKAQFASFSLQGDVHALGETAAPARLGAPETTGFWTRGRLAGRRHGVRERPAPWPHRP